MNIASVATRLSQVGLQVDPPNAEAMWQLSISFLMLFIAGSSDKDGAFLRPAIGGTQGSRRRWRGMVAL